jgi:HTH-type transcriptional regulator, competence development regulator
MSKGRKQTFGSLVRQERERRKIGLREMARRIGMSPTYLSMIERGEFAPPAEDKVTAIAKIIDHDRDELLALAGRVSSDLETKIMANPRLMAGLIREFSEVPREVDWDAQKKAWEMFRAKAKELYNRASAEAADDEHSFNRAPTLGHLGKLSSNRKPSRKSKKKADPNQF